MGDLLRIDLTTRTTSEETVPPQLIKELIGAKGIGTHYLMRGGRPRGRPAEPGQQAHLRRRPHGRHDDARQQPLRPVLRLAAHRRLRRVLLGRQPHAAVRAHRLQGRHRRGQGRRAGLPRDQRGGRRLPRRLRPLGHGRLQGRGRDPRAHRRTRRPRPASSARPARSSCASPASTTTTGTSSAAAAPARCTAPRTSRASSGTARRRSRSRGRTTSRPSSATSSSAPRTTPASPPTSAAARSTWCAS